MTLTMHECNLVSFTIALNFSVTQPSYIYNILHNTSNNIFHGSAKCQLSQIDLNLSYHLSTNMIYSLIATQNLDFVVTSDLYFRCYTTHLHDMWYFQTQISAWHQHRTVNSNYMPTLGTSLRIKWNWLPSEIYWVSCLVSWEVGNGDL